MLFNRHELITFEKLKPAVQELLRHNFTQEHLAQIKTIYPDAYNYQQEKYRNFGSVSKQEKYELVLTPVVEKINGRNTPDADNILKTASENSMSPTILLERRKKFYNALLGAYYSFEIVLSVIILSNLITHIFKCIILLQKE